MRNWLQVKKQSVSSKFSQLTDLAERELEEDKHMQDIYNHVIDKAEFLIKLEPSK